MEVALFYLVLCVSLTLASSETKPEVLIHVDPNRSQFFLYERVSLSCEVSDPRGVHLKRNVSARETELCPFSWGILKNSTCTITTTYSSDSGLYWCETSSGERSRTIRIRITSGSVILESPVLPVTAGDSMSLRCLYRTITSSKLTTNFYKDELFIGSSSTGNMTIHSVSTSDEGVYKCNISGVGESADSWLTVRVADPDAPADSSQLSVVRVISHVVVATPYLLTTAIMLRLVCKDKRRAAQDQRHDVVIELE